MYKRQVLYTSYSSADKRAAGSTAEPAGRSPEAIFARLRFSRNFSLFVCKLGFLAHVFHFKLELKLTVGVSETPLLVVMMMTPFAAREP